MMENLKCYAVRKSLSLPLSSIIHDITHIIIGLRSFILNAVIQLLLTAGEFKRTSLSEAVNKYLSKS